LRLVFEALLLTKPPAEVEDVLVVVAALVAVAAEVETGDEANVTPTSAQIPLAVAKAFARSAPVQEVSMQYVVLATKVGSVHRQWMSVLTQEPVLAFVRHGSAHAGYWRAYRAVADAEATAPRVTTIVEKSITRDKWW